jgi:hypothetical protein
VTPDFAEGLIAGFERIKQVIKIQRTDPAGTDATRRTLDTLSATIDIEIEAVEHVES